MPRTTQTPLRKKFKHKEKIIREFSDPKHQASHPVECLSILSALLEQFKPGRIKTELYRQCARCTSYLPRPEQLRMHATAFVTANLQQAMADALDPQLQDTNPRYCAALCQTILNHVASKDEQMIWQQHRNHLEMLITIKSHYRHPIEMCTSLVSSMLRFLIANPKLKAAILLQLKTFEHYLAPISIELMQHELQQLSSTHTTDPEFGELITLIKTWGNISPHVQHDNTQHTRDTAEAAVKTINQNMLGTHPISHQETLNYGNLFMRCAEQRIPGASRAAWYQYAAYCFALAMAQEATADGIKRFIECATDKEKNTAYGQLITQEISRNRMYNFMMTNSLERCLYANKQPFNKLVGCFTLASSQFSFFSKHAEQSVIDVTHQELKN